MLEIRKDASLEDCSIPFGVLEVRYPPRAEWRVDEWRALAAREIEETRARFACYERRAVFGEDPYFRFFRKFKKTYTVMLQFESVIVKGQPFPFENPVTEVPFLFELTTCMLSGTHDVERIEGGVELFLGTEKAPFVGMRGRELHTYPGDFCGRDGAGIIFSEIAGTDGRTCAREDSRHVIYPVFGTPGMARETVEGALAALWRYVQTLAPTAQTEAGVF